jgi:acyl carrier protein
MGVGNWDKEISKKGSKKRNGTRTQKNFRLFVSVSYMEKSEQEMVTTSELELHGKITRLLSEKVQIETSSIESDMVETGLLDSLKLVELMTSLEDEFGITISFDEIEIDNFRSVVSIAEYVNQR